MQHSGAGLRLIQKDGRRIFLRVTRKIVVSASEIFAQSGGDPFVATPSKGQALLLKDERAWAEYGRIAKLTPQ
jgi:hypothetical protein